MAAQPLLSPHSVEMALAIRSRVPQCAAKATKAAARPLRMVVRAQAQQSPVQALQALVKPAAVTFAANIIMAMPAAAEVG